MVVETPVFDGDEGPWNVRRQLLQWQWGACKITAAGERAALEVDDLNRWGPFGNFERLDRRQVCTDPGDNTYAADRNPKAHDQRPIY
jgi:hypothetical protein